MRSPDQVAMLLSVNDEQRIVLRLEVDPDADPITGTLSQAGQTEQPFTGWLGLTEVIESIRTVHREGATVRPGASVGEPRV